MQQVVLFFQSTLYKSWRDKLQGVYRYARKADWLVQVLPANISMAELFQQVKYWRPIGCLVDRGLSFARCPTRFSKHLPTVFLDQDPEKAPHDILNVVHDSTASAHMAVADLIRCDCASYLYYSGPIPAFWQKERERAFRDDITRIKKPFIIVRLEEDLMHALQTVPKPCGVFAAYDRIAQRVIAEANQLRIRIPGDLYVSSIDNDELICKNTYPPLTSVLPDFEKAGYELAKLLDEKIHVPQLNSVTIKYGPVELCRRETTCKLAKTDVRFHNALTYIRNNATRHDLCVEDVVREMKCSRRFADHLFREISGRSILEGIQEVRLEHVLSCLRKPELSSIGSIAGLCGFNSESYLKRFFKRKTGLTMRDWRSRNMDA